MGSINLTSVPKRLEDLTVRDIWDFIRIAETEIRTPDMYPPDEFEKINSFTHGFGNIFSRQAYYRHAYCRPLLRAMQLIFSRWEKPRVVDIGCGTAGQAILFASSGASVVGLDLDPAMLKTARSRITTFEQQNQKLDIRLESADVTKCDYASYGEFDVAYSHGCIARYVNASDIFTRLSPALSTGGLIIMKNQNPDCWLLKKTQDTLDLSTAGDFLEAAKRENYRPLVVAGTTGIPRKLWFAGELTHLPDALLRKFRSLQVHLELVFEKLG